MGGTHRVLHSREKAQAERAPLSAVEARLRGGARGSLVEERAERGSPSGDRTTEPEGKLVQVRTVAANLRRGGSPSVNEWRKNSTRLGGLRQLGRLTAVGAREQI
ncbi:uncharacterized protein M6B38_335275 [Iris pallida]|uniref:Uncharacterized protein n=1 Tax=Iris pallida TaxID=29817 RepID=A0AAX6EV71_IRIPA|nr:uncharacterized protein M6B38_169030 [Iris pallida]KAJ6834337.1 uncharacterized protein M6B38_335275 [Iris pallida]